MTDAVVKTYSQALDGLNMTREAGAQAIGVLDALYADGGIPPEVRPVVCHILAKWRAGQHLMETA